MKTKKNVSLVYNTQRKVHPRDKQVLSFFIFFFSKNDFKKKNKKRATQKEDKEDKEEGKEDKEDKENAPLLGRTIFLSFSVSIHSYSF